MLFPFIERNDGRRESPSICGRVGVLIEDEDEDEDDEDEDEDEDDGDGDGIDGEDKLEWVSSLNSVFSFSSSQVSVCDSFLFLFPPFDFPERSPFGFLFSFSTSFTSLTIS